MAVISTAFSGVTGLKINFSKGSFFEWPHNWLCNIYVGLLERKN